MSSKPGAPGAYGAAAAQAHSAYPPRGLDDEAPSEAAPFAMHGTERREREDNFHKLSPPNPLSEYLAKYLKSLVNLGTAIRDNILYNSPVIILTGGLVLGANHLAAGHYPSLAGSSDLSFEGSVNVAKFVSVALLLEAALAPLFQNVERNAERRPESRAGGTIHAKTIHYLNPLALTLIFAYKTGLNVKELRGTLYTVGIFALIKALGMNYDYALKEY